MYQIITDGSWDMGSERATRFGVDVVPYYVTMDGEHYLKDIEELDVRQYVRRDLLRQIDAEPLRGDDKGAGRSQRCEHALRFFRRKLCKGAHGAQRFKGIAMVRAHHLGRIQNQLIELQP